MNRSPVYVILIIVVSLLTGCRLLGSRNSTGHTHFPKTPGSTWTYAVSDSTSPSKLDTLRVSILQTDTTSGQIQSLWKFKFTDHTDTITVASSGSTLHFDFPQGLRVSPQSFVVTKIVFPLEVDKKWTDDTSSYSVVSKDTVSWSGGTFNESYRMVQKISANPNVGTITYWIEPNVGIVKAHYHEIFGGYTPTQAVYLYSATWTLLSYKLNPVYRP